MPGRHKLVVMVAAGLALTGALTLVLALAAVPSSARSAAGCTPSWQAVPDALGRTAWIATDSPTDAWAQNYGSKFEHWDGQKWSLSPAPRWFVAHYPTLSGQPWLSDFVISPTDAWAVGGRWVKPHHPHGIQSLIEHWNGRSWKVVPSPKIGHPTRFVATAKNSWLHGEKIPLSGDQLNALAAVSANNIWAVGVYDVALNPHKPKTAGEYRSRLLTEHWNGKKWTVASTRPTLPGYGQEDSPIAEEDILTSLAAAPSGAVLGLADPLLSDASFTNPLWWLHVSTWRPDKSLPHLRQPTAITITSQQDAWVFGDNSTASTLKPVPAAHWDGNHWLPTQLPALGTVIAAAASAPNNVWVAGTLKPTTGNSSQNWMFHYTCS
jgi:hypothetical protein